MPNPTPQSIAEKLSEAQRRALLMALPTKSGDGFGIYARKATIVVMIRLGLVGERNRAGDGGLLTPLGLQVRAILSRKEQNDG